LSHLSIAHPSPLVSPSAVALRRLARITGWWDLSAAEEASLTGRPQAAPPLRLRRTGRDIAQLVAALDKVRHASMAAGYGPDWLRRASNHLGGQSPLGLLAEGADGVETVLDSLETPGKAVGGAHTLG